VGLVGIVAVSALAGAIAATSLGLNSKASAISSPLAGLSTPGPTASPTATAFPTGTAVPTASPTPVPTPTTVPDPLTGRLVTPDVAMRHPIAVMIDDLGPARPQSGLSSASIVWQAPAEGGIPRYMAIFQETMPTSIGPVRSSRYYYIAWAAEWRSVYAHAGGSPQALDTLRAKGSGQYVYNVDEFRYAATFHRITTRFAPHNLYTSGAKLTALEKGLGAKPQVYTPVWHFAPDAPLDQRPYGGTISVGYPDNAIKYTYDRDTNTYLRSVTGEKKETDAGTGARIAPKNVIVMRMSFGPLNDGHPAKHRLEADVVGSGTAWISTNGRTIKGTWKKTSILKPTLFFDGQGNPVTLTAGQTFVQVLTQSTTDYPFSFKAGSDTPPATPSPSP
jgi:hypothetical protein